MSCFSFRKNQIVKTPPKNRRQAPENPVDESRLTRNCIRAIARYSVVKEQYQALAAAGPHQQGAGNVLKNRKSVNKFSDFLRLFRTALKTPREGRSEWPGHPVRPKP